MTSVQVATALTNYKCLTSNVIIMLIYHLTVHKITSITAQDNGMLKRSKDIVK